MAPRVLLLLALLPIWQGTEAATPTDDRSLVVRAWFADESAIGRVAPLLGHAQIDRSKGLLRTEADAALRKALQEAGFRIEIDAEASARVADIALARSGAKSIPGYACYRTVEETDSDMAVLAAAYPDLLSLQSIGQSWQAVNGSSGYDLRIAVATNRGKPGPKPALFLLSSIHAREYTPAELGTRFIEDLVLGYGHDPEATWLLDHHAVHVLLQGNPDGRKRAESGLSWRKNWNPTHCGEGSWPGVDLNRNFPFEWGQHGGSSGSACDQTFRGPVPASEPETQAVIDYVRALYPDLRGPALDDPAPDSTQGIFIDLHSFSRLVLWPWGFSTLLPPNSSGLATLGRRLAWFNNYTAEQAIGLYPTDGTTDDFAYGDLGVPAFTFELGTAFFQDCASFENTIYPDNQAALRYAARSAGAPYRQPAGPDAFELLTSPDLALVGEPVRLQAVLDDSRQQTIVTGASGPVPAVQDVTSARFFVATAPWEAGADGQPMQPADGAFDSPRESVQGDIDTTGLAAGQHLVFVQGRDADGNDGPPNAAFLELIEASDAVLLEGSVRQAGSLMPLAASIRSGRFETHSSALDGSFRRVLPPGSFDLEISAAGHESLLQFGLTGNAGSSVTQHATLFQLCTLLEDPAEIDSSSPFTAASPWILRGGMGSGGGDSWLPTAGSSYANNLNVSLTSPALDLTDHDAPVLQFDSRCDTEASYDFGRVETSVDGGLAWNEVFRCDGETSWRRVSLTLPEMTNAADARLRFRFTSDSSVTAPGWAIDNIELQAGGAACRATQTPELPVSISAFSASPGQVVAGAPSLLAWQTSHAESCEILSNAGSPALPLSSEELASGQREVSPAQTTAYTLACTGNNSSTQAEIELQVFAPTELLRDGFEPIDPPLRSAQSP